VVAQREARRSASQDLLARREVMMKMKPAKSENEQIKGPATSEPGPNDRAAALAARLSKKRMSAKKQARALR
jgi:hypothetical protein